MSCILRASGENFDVDQFLSLFNIEPIKFWRRGEARFKSSPDGEKNKTSGVNFEVSPADFAELELQFEDAKLFFQENADLVRRLRAFPGVEGVTVDFGAEIHPPGWCWFSFPPDLLVLIGSLDVQLMLSVYPVSEDDEPKT